MPGRQVQAPHPCITCGKTFTARSGRAQTQKVCSRTCNTGRPHSVEPVTRTCLECGKDFTVVPSGARKTQKLCGTECRNAHTIRTRTKRVPWTCPFCGKTILLRPFRATVQKFCSYSCGSRSKNNGAGNPAWKGGNAHFWKQKARERDDFTCQYPECNIRDTGKKTHAHHKVPRAAGGPDSLENLVTLCNKHHRMIEGFLLKKLIMGLDLHTALRDLYAELHIQPDKE